MHGENNIKYWKASHSGAVGDMEFTNTKLLSSPLAFVTNLTTLSVGLTQR
jgi:hypothetical protein